MSLLDLSYTSYIMSAFPALGWERRMTPPKALASTYIACFEVATDCIELVRFGKFGDAHSKVAQFVHRCRSCVLVSRSKHVLGEETDLSGSAVSCSLHDVSLRAKGGHQHVPLRG
jgi:hypothetical protein